MKKLRENRLGKKENETIRSSNNNVSSLRGGKEELDAELKEEVINPWNKVEVDSP